MPLLVLVGGTVVTFSVLAPRAWLVVLTDGVLAAAVLLAAGGWGAWPARWLGAGRTGVQRFCVAVALGLGTLAFLVLGLGLAGILSRFWAWALVGLGFALGVGRLHAGRGEHGSPGRRHADPLPGGKAEAAGARIPSRAPPNGNPCARPSIRRAALMSLCVLPLCVPTAVALFGAALPPGILWVGEARGYDALEYHLQVPREYFQAGRIHFLGHNVYASFPQQVESLFLLLMHLRGDPWRAAVPAQMLHAGLGMLAVLALAAWARPGWPRIIAATLAGSVPWLAYLGALAYVELGVLFLAAVAGGIIVDGSRTSGEPSWRELLTAGLCAGLAGGCKYTAIALVPAGLGMAWLVTARGAFRARAQGAVVLIAGALLALSPWLARNAALTGNPVYPFAYGLFGGTGWSPEQAEQWSRGHEIGDSDGQAARRLRIALDELLRSPMFGAVLWLLPLAMIAGPSRITILAVLWLAAIVSIWATATHMPGRFAVPLVIPLALLAGDAGHRSVRDDNLAGARRALAVALATAVVVIGFWQNGTLLGLLRRESTGWQARTGIPLAWMAGRTELLRDADVVNDAIADPNAYVWLVGNAAVFYVTRPMHYTVVFNRDPWLEFAQAEQDAAAAVAWLRARNVSHVVFSWREIARLRRTYGFSPLVTREWVRELAAAGLRRIRPAEPAAGAGVEVYEVLAE